jgi:toxin-antitoxin system PIN domain toxin
MIALDSNLLLYACDPDTAHHKPAYDHLRRLLSGYELIGIPLQSISAFLRISTQKGVLLHPFPMQDAIGIVEEWLALSHVKLLLPGDRFWPIFKTLIAEGGITGRSVTDTEIAALAIEYGCELHTYDRGFARFPGLRWRNPLAKA